MATPNSLRRDLEQIWAPDTAVDPAAWTPECPSTGHCAVTALLVAEYTDAVKIMRVVLHSGESHYYNAYLDGRIVDLTRDQFPQSAIYYVGEPEERTFGYLLSNEGTRQRWERLRNRLGEHWTFNKASVGQGGGGVE